MDSFSNGKSNGTGVILEGPNIIVLEYLLKFNFKATNNQAEYEALVANLQLVKEIWVWALNIKNDSQLVIAQVNGRVKLKNHFR